MTVESEDTSAWVWEEGSSKIATKLAAFRDSPYDTVAVFAMAPIPLLVFLGSDWTTRPTSGCSLGFEMPKTSPAAGGTSLKHRQVSPCL